MLARNCGISAADQTKLFQEFQQADNATVWTGRVLQVRCELWRVLVLRFCIRPVNRAFVLLAIMDIRAHPISF